MDFYFRQQCVGETTYLVLDIEDDDVAIDSFAMNMMTYNHIPNLVQIQIVRMNDRKQIQFQITGLTKLHNRMAAPRPKKEVLSIFNSILNAFEEVDAYMLNMDHLLLNWDYVYIDGQDNCKLLYLPFDHSQGRSQIEFLQDAVGRVIPDYQERDPYLYDILNAFSRNAVQKLSDFRELIKKHAGVMNEGCQEEKKNRQTADRVEVDEANLVILKAQEEDAPGHVEKKPVGKSEWKADRKQDAKSSSASRIPVINIPGREPGTKTASMQVPQKKEERKKEQKREEEKKEKKSLFKKNNERQNPFGIPRKQKEAQGGTVNWESSEKSENTDGTRPDVPDRQRKMYEGYENTVMMQDPWEIQSGNTQRIWLEQPGSGVGQARLIRKHGGTVYRLQGDKMVVGSGAAADIRISDNQAVSRIHAFVFAVNGEYYVEDNRSKNGTFLNSRRILPETREPVFDGAVLTFANEDFEFSLN